MTAWSDFDCCRPRSLASHNFVDVLRSVAAKVPIARNVRLVEIAGGQEDALYHLIERKLQRGGKRSPNQLGRADRLLGVWRLAAGVQQQRASRASQALELVDLSYRIRQERAHSVTGAVQSCSTTLLQ